MTLLHMSLAGGMMILVIALFRAVFQHRIHRTALLILWVTAALRLLLPVTISSPVSVFNLLTPVRQAVPTLPANSSTAPVPAVTTAPAIPAAAQGPSFWTLEHILLLVWAVGAAAVLFYFLSNHLRNRRQYQFSLPWEPSPVDLPKRVRIRSLERITAPLTYGILRPMILVPEDFRDLETEKQRQMLLHELAHIRHRDVLTKALFLLVLMAHWFNPLVWVMVYLATQDMEMRADADAVRQLGSKLPYAKTLVEVEARRLDGYLTTGFSYSSTGARLKALQKGRTSLWRSALALILLLLLTLSVFATEARAIQPEPQTEALPEDAGIQASEASPHAPAGEISAPPDETQQPVHIGADHRKPEPLEISPEAQRDNLPSETGPDTAPAAETQPTEEPAETAEPKPTEPTGPKPTDPAPTQAEPAETQSPAPAQAPTESGETQSAEPEPASDSHEPVPVSALPTELSISNPGNVTLSVNQSWSYTASAPTALHFAAQSASSHYSLDSSGTTVFFTAFEPGTYALYVSFGSSGYVYWTTITVTE